MSFIHALDSLNHTEPSASLSQTQATHCNKFFVPEENGLSCRLLLIVLGSTHPLKTRSAPELKNKTVRISLQNDICMISVQCSVFVQYITESVLYFMYTLYIMSDFSYRGKQ